MTEIAQERARIARELHDGIAQELAAIGYSLDSEIGRTDTALESRKALREIRDNVTNLNAKVRDEIFQLRSTREVEVQEQLEAALEALDVDFAVVGRLPNDSSGIELFKVLLELSRNAKEHAKATALGIDIGSERISIESDGYASKFPRNEGHGLIGIAERLHAIGWEMSYKKGFTQIDIHKVK